MILIVLIVGFLIGVAINALADSIPVQQPVRDIVCGSCGAPRPVRAWSGVGAFIFKARVCKYCGVQRTWRAPIVELLTVLITLALYTAGSLPSPFWPSLIVGGVFLLIIVIDIEHRLIPHIIVGPAAVAFLIIGILDPTKGFWKVIAGGAAGAGMVFILYLFGGLFARFVAWRRGEPLEEIAFGFGDVTLAGLIGLAVGWPGVILAIFLGVLAAGVFSLGYLIFQGIRGRYSAYTAIPYAPFLILGASLIYFGGRALFVDSGFG